MKRNLSAMKRARQNEKRRLRNSHYKSMMKTYIKKVRDAISKRDRELIDQSLKEAISVIDRVASKGIIHKRTAARKKSRLFKAVRRMMESSQA